MSTTSYSGGRDHIRGGEEIDSYRRVSLTGTEPGLVGYWKFDEATGTTTADASRHDGDLTLYGGAIWTLSTAPVNVVGVGPRSNAPPTSRIVAFPNPATREATILLETHLQESARVSVFDQGGRRIANLWSGSAAPGGRLIRWDGRDAAGHEVASGVYLVRYESPNSRIAARLLVLR